MAIKQDPQNTFWQRVLAATDRACERWGGDGAIGYADLGGNLDILASLRGTQPLLYDLHDEPEEVERLSGLITDAWLYYYNELDALDRAAVPGVVGLGARVVPVPDVHVAERFLLHGWAGRFRPLCAT